MERFNGLGTILSLAALTAGLIGGAWLGYHFGGLVAPIVGGAAGFAAAFVACLKFWNWREGR